ncbi:MAG: hypothetical protein WBB28_22670 [Crinalium sp.]
MLLTKAEGRKFSFSNKKAITPLDASLYMPNFPLSKIFYLVIVSSEVVRSLLTNDVDPISRDKTLKYYQKPMKTLSLRLPFLGSALILSLITTSCASNVLSQVKTQPLNPQNHQTTPTVTQENNQKDRRKSSTTKQSWVTLLPGEEEYKVKFAKDGSLSHQGKILISKIPVSYSSDGSVFYAINIILSNPSPSGNFHFFQACDTQGLCWALYLIDKNQSKVYRTSAGKYGSYQWVQWSKDEQYAILADQNEGDSRIYAIDLKTGDSKSVDIGSRAIDLKSFSWLDSRKFKVKIINHPACVDCKPNQSKSYWFNGNITNIRNK